MIYEDALREWGARKLEASIGRSVDRSTVTVEFVFSPSRQWSEITFDDAMLKAEIRASEHTPGGIPPITPTPLSEVVYFDLDETFDMGAVIREVIEVGNDLAS